MWKVFGGVCRVDMRRLMPHKQHQDTRIQVDEQGGDAKDRHEVSLTGQAPLKILVERRAAYFSSDPVTEGQAKVMARASPRAVRRHRRRDAKARRLPACAWGHWEAHRPFASHSLLRIANLGPRSPRIGWRRVAPDGVSRKFPVLAGFFNGKGRSSAQESRAELPSQSSLFTLPMRRPWVRVRATRTWETGDDLVGNCPCFLKRGAT